MNRVPPARSVRVAVAVVIVLAAALRFWGLDVGLPNITARPDEREMLVATSGFPSGDFNPRFFVYPNLFMYVGWVWIEAVLHVIAVWKPQPPYAALLLSNPALPLLAGRALSALAGTVTVWIAWRAGREASGSALGLVSAVLIATAWLHVRDSHALKTEALLSMGVLTSLWMLSRWAAAPSARRAVVAGLAIGLTMGFKYPAILLVAPAWVASAATSARRGVASLRPTRSLVVVLAVAAVCFAVTNPFLFLDAHRMVDTMSFVGQALYTPRPDTSADATTFGYHLAVSLRHGVGALTTLAIVPAIVLAWWQPAPMLVRLAATFFLVWFPFAAMSPVHMARYVTPLVPAVALLVAHLLVTASAWLAGPRRAALLAVLTLACAAEPLSSSIAGDRIAAREDTRVLATRWMAEHLPKDAVVAALGANILPFGEPALPPGVRKAPVSTPAQVLASDAAYVVTHEHHVLPFSRVDAEQMAALRDHLQLLAEFRPWAGAPAGGFEQEDAYYVPFWDFAGVERPGPDVRIWAVRRPLTSAPPAR